MGFGIEESAEFRKELGADVMVDYWIRVQFKEFLNVSGKVHMNQTKQG